MKPNALRGAVVELFRQGKNVSVIAKTLNMAKSTVSDAIKRFQELGTLDDRTGRGKKRTVRTPKMREIIRRRIKRKCTISIRKLAKSLKISKTSVAAIVHDDLKLQSYKLCKNHYLNDTMRANRFRKAKVLLNQLAEGRHRSVLFTDEKIFTIEQHHNHQNDRQLLPATSKNRGSISRSHHPASVMVWAGITHTGKTPLIFIDKGVKVNQTVYQKLLTDSVAPWAAQHFGKKDWIFQQDWAPAHGAKKTISLCERLFPSFFKKEEWPSNSPDLNPMDYSVWSILESRACRTPHKSIEHLKSSLLKAWEEITAEELAAIVDNFPKRLKACISARGGHFEMNK